MGSVGGVSSGLLAGALAELAPAPAPASVSVAAPADGAATIAARQGAQMDMSAMFSALVVALSSGGVTGAVGGGLVAPASVGSRIKVGPNQLVPGTNLRTDAKGNLTIKTPGVVIDGIDLAGSINVQAADVTIRNSRIRGPQDGQVLTTGLINATSPSVRNLTIENNLLQPDQNVFVYNGIVGHDYTARGNEISRTGDGLGVFNTHGPQANVLIEGNYIHDLAWAIPDPERHPEGSHNDGIQVQGGSGIVIRNNRIETFNARDIGLVNHPQWSRYAMQGIMVQNNVSPVSDVLISGNHVSGGTSGIHLVAEQSGDIARSTISDNTIHNDQRPGPNTDLQILLSGPVGDVSGLLTNRRVDGTPLAIGKGGGIRGLAS